MTDLQGLPPGDYVSPELEVVRPDAAFPNMIVGDTDLNSWPYLRREVHHNWYVDQRNPTVGFCSRDEVAILYNTARQFINRPCLEIGCWRGWSTCHLALGSRGLDVIDPMLADASFLDDVSGSLQRAGVLDAVTFYDGPSPNLVESIALDTGKRWSFAFIDGDHEGEAPRKDAAVVARYAAEDALVLMHDLASPHVANGLRVFREHGWNTMIYQTMQIMGVAWRGAARPVNHIPDPTQEWALPAHLVTYPVSGEHIEERTTRFVTLMREHEELLCRFDQLHAKHIELLRRVQESETERSRLESEAATVSSVRDASPDDCVPNDRVLAGLVAHRLRRRAAAGAAVGRQAFDVLLSRKRW